MPLDWSNGIRTEHFSAGMARSKIAKLCCSLSREG